MTQANVLGLGWAATPAGHKAMEELSKPEDDRRHGKLPEPVRKKGNIIVYRSQYGSVNPSAVVGPGIAATAVSTIVAIVYCKLMDGKRRV